MGGTRDKTTNIELEESTLEEMNETNARTRTHTKTKMKDDTFFFFVFFDQHWKRFQTHIHTLHRNVMS